MTTNSAANIHTSKNLAMRVLVQMASELQLHNTAIFAGNRNEADIHMQTYNMLHKIISPDGTLFTTHTEYHTDANGNFCEIVSDIISVGKSHTLHINILTMKLCVHPNHNADTI